MYNYLSNKNTKLKRSGIFSFGIPAFQAKSGFRTCPGAKDCVLGCYAKQGFFVMPSVRAGQEKRLELTFTDHFPEVMSAELKRRKVKILRIHDSGDFYSEAYLKKWLTVVEQNPKVQFYAYTKMVPLFAKRILPANFKVIFSYGGKWDHRIVPEIHAHAQVFPSTQELKKAKYADSSRDDSVALRSRKVGLVYHGAKSKFWSTLQGTL